MVSRSKIVNTAVRGVNSVVNETSNFDREDKTVLRAGERLTKKAINKLFGKKKRSSSRRNPPLLQMRIKVKTKLPPEEVSKRIQVLGELIVNEIKRNVEKYDLIARIGGGAYLQGWFALVRGNKLIIDNTQSYAPYLEYGTYDFGRQYSDTEWPSEPIKKQDLPEELRSAYPKGMNPFAPMRRVIYNESLMKQLVMTAFK